LAFASLFLPWQRWFGGKLPESNQKSSVLDTARKLFAQNRLDKLIRLAGSINPKAPESAEIYSLAGQAFLAKGQVGLAKQALERSLELKLEQPESLKYLAAIFLASGDSARGLALLEFSAKLKPDDFQPWLAIGKVRQETGEFIEAFTAYEECLKRKPPAEEARQARMGRIRALIDDHKEEQAQPLISEALQLDPENPDLFGLAAISAQTLGLTEQAEARANQALKQNATEPNALLAMAQLAFLNDNAVAAEALLKKAVVAKPNHPPILQLLMQVQARQGKTIDAAATKKEFQALSGRILQMDKLIKEISQKPDDPKPRYEMGQLAVEGQMKVLAEQCFRAALEIDPAFEPARQALENLKTETTP
jgi:tetratricopeptide (TPR) repeat protein